MPKITIPKELSTDYPNRVGDVPLTTYPGDQSVEGYYNNTVLLTHEGSNSSPIIYIICNRKTDRPDVNLDDCIVQIASAKDIDTEINYSNSTFTENKINSGVTKGIVIKSNDNRIDSKKNTLISAGNKIIISGKDVIIEANGDIKIKTKGTIEIDGTSIRLGQVAAKKVVNELFRETYNLHTHSNGNNGNPTGPPIIPMNQTQLTSKTKIE